MLLEHAGPDGAFLLHVLGARMRLAEEQRRARLLGVPLDFEDRWRALDQVLEGARQGAEGTERAA